MKKKLLRIVIIIILTAVIGMTVAGLALSVYVAAKMEREIDESLFDVLSGNTASQIYYYADEKDREEGKGTLLEGGELYGGFRSKPVKYSELSRELIFAFVSIEDKRFFQHSGVDWKRTLGAGINSLLKFRDEFGGSTITQQLIKNVTGKDEYSADRKIQEILWALDLETKLSKEEILQNYFNIINLSNGCYGVGAASEYYFSKEPSELSLAEAAAIAAITNNPSYYDPIRNPENNKARRDLILKEMYEQEYISEAEYSTALASPLTLNIGKSGNDGINSWYVDMVINDVIEELVAKNGYTRQMASYLIYTGGLRIYTAMDIEIQKTVEEYYKDTDNFYWTDREGPQSSMMIIDPYSGDILAVAGAVGEKSGNRLQSFATETVRPAGSVIKPLSVYAAALEEGIISWSSVYDDVPINFGKYNLDESKGQIIEPVAWPKNANGVYRGLTNINYAVEHSVNTVTVRVLEELGLSKAFEFLNDKLHIEGLVEKKTLPDGSVITDKDYAALALGQFNYGVSLRDITAAYSIFPNRGVYNKSRSFHKVTDASGNIILENKYEGQVVISEENSVIMTKMLENVVRNGTASRVTLKNSIACAGKTGTTQSNYDRWFIGYTPYYICGVWYGYEYPKALSGNSGAVCVEVWDELMTKLHKTYVNNGIREFSSSDNVITAEYCADSGKLATAACKKDPRGNRIEEGYFAKGTEPKDKCDRHILVKYDTVEGGIASEQCDILEVEYVGLIKAERSFPKQIYVSDAQYVYREIPKDIMPETSPELPYFNNIFGEHEYGGISYGKQQFNRYCRAHFDYWKWQEEQRP